MGEGMEEGHSQGCTWQTTPYLVLLGREAKQGKVVNVWLLLIGGSFLPFLEIEGVIHLCSLSGQA